MEEIYSGTSCWFGGCSGRGPWAQADLEYGPRPGVGSEWKPHRRAFTGTYVTAAVAVTSALTAVTAAGRRPVRAR